MVPVQTGSETVSGNMGMPRLETKQSGIFGKIPDLDQDRRVWSSPDQVPIGSGPNFPNTIRVEDFSDLKLQFTIYEDRRGWQLYLVGDRARGCGFQH